MGFIYKVTNNINNKVYIGQSIFDINKRFKEHLNDSKNPNKNQRPFYFAINKYGEENFSISLIEEVDNKDLNEREKYWISFYRSYVGFEDCNGYNATLGGDSKLTKDYQLIIDDYLITKSKTQTSKNLGCCIETVSRALESNHIQTINKSSGHSIIRIDDKGKEVTYDSIRQAAEEIAQKQQKNLQTVRKRINAVLLHKNNQKAYGYFWKENL